MAVVDRAGLAPRHRDFDRAIIGDMTVAGDRALRIALEIEASARAGERIGLFHLPSPGSGKSIAPDIQGRVSLREAHPVGREHRAICGTAIVVGPELIRRPPALDAIVAERAEIVADVPIGGHALKVDRWLAGRYGAVMWSPATDGIRARLAAEAPGIAIAPGNRPVPLGDRAHPGRTGRRVAIGAIGWEPGDWPADIETMTALFPTGDDLEVLLLGRLPAHLRRVPSRWGILEPEAMALGRLLERLDALLLFPAEIGEPPRVAIAAMLAAGKPVLMDPRFEPLVGPGPIYCAAHEAASILRRRVAEPAFRRAPARANGSAGARPAAPPAVIFVPSNGVGLGHVNRLLAIARRCRSVTPIFATQAQAPDIIESHGFFAHYLPGHNYLGVVRDDWEPWFQAELEWLIDAFSARAVVYDGNAPGPGLVRAVGSRGGCRLVWIRGGMAGRARMPYLDNTPYCDLVIEPGELAETADDGVTSMRRFEATVVDPVLLLDRAELLPRDAARAELGIAADRTAVLIQLGAGANRDIIGLTDQIIATLRQHEGVEIVVAEWATGVPAPRVWPGVRVMRGHPFARYYNAFDFAFAAAGYSTFHEGLAAALPTIFVPNGARSMDDQVGRARYAEEHDLALHLEPAGMSELSEMIAALMAEPARAYLRNASHKLGVANGAATAAALVEAAALSGEAA